MRINTSEFFIENKILEANENEIIYDLPRQKIQETWDKLSVFYTQKSLEDNKEEIVENEFYLDLTNSRIENETAITTYDLSNKKIIGKYECKEPKEMKSNIKKHILEELTTIISNGIEELEDNIRNEKEFYQEIKEYDNEIIIFDKSIQIATNQFKYLNFEDFIKIKNDKEKIGLFCSIKLNGIELKGFHSISNLTSIPDCQSLESKYSQKGLEINIRHEYVDSRNEIISSFIEEIYNGKMLSEIIDSVPVLFSRYFLNQLILNSSTKKIIQTNGKKLIDGLSAVFYCITDKDVFKIIREQFDFKILCNGRLIKIENEIL